MRDYVRGNREERQSKRHERLTVIQAACSISKLSVHFTGRGSQDKSTNCVSGHTDVLIRAQYMNLCISEHYSRSRCVFDGELGLTILPWYPSDSTRQMLPPQCLHVHITVSSWEKKVGDAYDRTFQISVAYLFQTQNLLQVWNNHVSFSSEQPELRLLRQVHNRFLRNVKIHERYW